MNPITLNCMQYLVLGLFAHPITITKGDIIESSFLKGNRLWLIARALVGVIPNMIGFYSIQVLLWNMNKNLH